MVAETTAEIHGTINPLISHTANTAALLKRISKALPEEDAKAVKEFHRGNASKVEGFRVTFSQSRKKGLLSGNLPLR